MKKIHIAKDFSDRPLGRHDPEDGQYSGEKFRKQFLVPALRDRNETISINLVGLKMLTTSFMEEAFGGLVRYEGFDADDLLQRITFEYTDPFDADYVNEIKSDIKHAEP